eukprot:4764120-Prorocentrum_lima.AAC.1
MIVAEAVTSAHDGCACHPGPEDNLRMPGKVIVKSNTKVGVVSNDRMTVGTHLKLHGRLTLSFCEE